jgi:tetratricopeptide (TPR) repeat protein
MLKNLGILLAILAFVSVPVFGQTTATGWLDKGNALYDQDKKEEAVQAYDKAIELNPQYVEAWVAKGKAVSGFGESIACFDEAIKINPNYVKAWDEKGRMLDFLSTFSYLSEGKAAGDRLEQEALQCFDEVTRIEPNNINALKSKGKVLKTLGMYTEAQLCYDKILSDKTIDNWTAYTAWENKGNIYSDVKDYDPAIECYDRAISLYDHNTTEGLYDILLIEKSKALIALGRTDEAAAVLSEARQLGYTGPSPV